MEANPRGETTPADLGARASLLVDKHAAYIKKVAEVRTTPVTCCWFCKMPYNHYDNLQPAQLSMQTKDSLEAHLTEHFRLSGVYWGLTALYLMGHLDAVDGPAILDWVRSVTTLALQVLKFEMSALRTRVCIYVAAGHEMPARFWRLRGQ